jgi:hypothetical protein
MSKRYPGGIISKTAPVPSGPYENSTAPGIWTLEQQAAYAKLGQWPTVGNVDPSNLYIEYLFSTYVYEGNGTSQTITNGINLSGKGGLIWTKKRNGGTSHFLINTVNGITSGLNTNNTDAAANWSTEEVTGFTSTGYTLGPSTNNGYTNYGGGNTYVSWTFREQPKFFDVVTYTGNDIAGRTIAHNLGSVPGCIIVKNLTSGARDWEVFHTSLGATKSIQLNLTTAATTSVDYWNNTAPTSTQFTVGGNNTVNTDTHNYVAYLFAHNAGGFGASGTDNVISCGGTTLDASGFATVSLGYEPQFVMIKSTQYAGDWAIYDTMRGAIALKSSNLYSAFDAKKLRANTSASESTAADYVIAPSSTGFTLAATGYAGAAYDDFIYIAIRKGPMQTPTVGTSVYNTVGGSGANPAYVAGFPVDLALRRYPAAEQGNKFYSRLTGTTYLDSTSTAAEVTDANGKFDYQNAWFSNPDGAGYYSWMWRRAPGFFDEVCYIGTGANTTVTHNLGVVPEMMIVRYRSGAEDWGVYTAATGNTGSLRLNTTGSFIVQSVVWNNTTPTASVFSIGSNSMVNNNAGTYVAYLFATCAGVSKVGSYTGTGTTLQINCGFTAGSRFVLIKRTDSTGDWYVWDSARGIVAGNDPYLLLNSTAAEVTGTDYVDTYAAGFEISSTAPAAINASGGTYIFLAIA